MAKAQSRKLKVFAARFGFYDSVVAAPSQAAALRAWGTDRNLFAEGAARLETDDAAINAALAQPEVPLRRAIGSAAPFGVDPGMPTLTDVSPPQKRPPRSKAAPEPRRTPPPPPPDRSKLEAAESELRGLDDEWQRKEAELERRRRALEGEAAQARQSWERRRGEAERAVERERRAFRKAGGRI